LRVGLSVSVFIGDDVGSSRQNRGGSADFVGEVSFGWGRVSGGQGRGGEGEHYFRFKFLFSLWFQFFINKSL
jgi:hypothetical protein